MRQWMRVSGGVSLAFLVSVGGALPLSGQLGGRAAEDWAITLESGRRLAGLEIAEVVSRIGLQPGDVAADIGAGTGIFTVPIAMSVGPTGAVLAVEVDEGFLPMIAEKAEAEGLGNVETVLGEFGDPMLPRRDVDVAFFHDVLHHIEGRQAYLEALAAYMASESRIVVVDYDMNVEGVPHSNDPAMLIGPEQVNGWMENIGFEVDEVVDMFDDKFYIIYSRVD